MLDVCLLGTSGMMPLPGRWLTSLLTRLNGSSLLNQPLPPTPRKPLIPESRLIPPLLEEGFFY